MQGIQKPTFIYWEEQGSDLLCGVHCINALLQGPYYNEVELANIAIELDQQEKALMMEHGDDTKDFKKYLAEGSNNVADDGNYSIQVIAESLKRTAGLTVESVDRKVNKSEDLTQEQGFICNSASHWFTIRNVGGIFYNLNSTNEEGPEIISDFYLSAFLMSIKENGYTIFVVKGDFPVIDKSSFQNLRQSQRFLPAETVQAINEQRKKQKKNQLNIGGTDERDLEKAKKASLLERKKQGGGGGGGAMEQEGGDDDEEGKFAGGKFPPLHGPPKEEIKSFQGQGISLGGGGGGSGGAQGAVKVPYQNMLIDQSIDPEFASVVRMSLADKFSGKPAAEGVTLQFRHADGSKSQWTFPFDARIEDLYDFALFKIPPQQSYQFYLSISYPQYKVLQDLQAGLFDEGIEDMTNITVSKA